MTVKKEGGQIGPLTASKAQTYRATMANPTITNGSPTTIKKTSAPSRSEFEGGCQDSAYRVNVAASKPKTNAPIARLHISA